MIAIISKVFPLVCSGVLLVACSGNARMGGDAVKSQPPLKQLAAMDWQLSGIKRGLMPPTSRLESGLPVQRYHLRFQGGSMRLQGGCNLMNGAVKVKKAGKMRVGPLMMTNRGCNRNLMQADAEIGNTLAQVTNYHLQPRQLALLGARKILLFDGMPTPETAYGGKGQRKFIDIRNAASGLQWREAKYNKKWVRTNKDAPWSTAAFPGIQGFAPQPNYEYIVRINEFRDPKSGKPVWIKDIVTSQGLLR